MESGGTLVVPSAPRAASVQLGYGRTRLESARQAWRMPDVIAYRAWLEREAYRAADAGHPVPRPLRAAEEWLLWREAASSAARAEGLDAPGRPGAPERLAESLQRAAWLLHEWEIAPSTLRSSARAESRLLARALEHVEARARELHAAASHELARLLREWRPARPVTFAGFTEQSAAQRALLRAWGGGLVRCAEPAGGPQAQTVIAVRAGDADEELQLAAQWCLERLEHDPAARLLVVVPELSECRLEALRVFRRVLAPQAVIAGGADEPDAVAVEGGTPLGGEPLVRHALDGLGFLLRGAEATQVSAWLRASFWSAPDPVARARLDAALRQVLDVEVTPLALLGALRDVTGPLAGAADRLRGRLDAALRAIAVGSPGPPGSRESPGSVAGAADAGVSLASTPAALGEWARRFELALRELEWPGERAPTPREQQAVARFEEALGDLAAIGGRTGAVGAGEGLRMLAALVDRRTLAMPYGDAPVTLTAALADPLVRYDGIWIAGLHAEAWPAPAAPDPFIPFAAQRRAGIPAAAGASRLAQAREVLRRCRRAADRMVVSWPARGAQREYVPSPLLAELQPADAEPAQRGDSLARRIRASRRIERFEDPGGEPWPARSPLPSGTRAIEYQSRCPFRAYAELRLASVPLAAARPGVGALDRGRLLHRALELLWGGLGGSEGLEAHAAGGTLLRRIEECVAAAGDETLPVPRSASARAAQRRERRRAVHLLLELAELERRRPPFRVRSTELRRSLEIEGAALEVRIDRLDELEDGSCAVFDYKTGRAAAPDWLAERIADPQLLVYSLAAGARVSALAMIHLAPRRIAFRGMADRRDRLPPRIEAPPQPELWPSQIERWGQAVARLARGFLQGAAAADPLGDACAMCHLHGFCRIAEAAAPAASPTDAGDE